MSRFELREIRVDNYRCFEELRLSLEEDITVLFAENGGGKTALLTALAMGLAVFQSGAPRTLKVDPRRDPTMRTLDEKGRREPVGPCKVAWTAAVGRIGIGCVVHGSPSRVRTHYQSAPTNSRGTWSDFECPEIGGRCSRGTGSIAWRGRRRSGRRKDRANGGPVGSLRLRARPKSRRGSATPVAPGRVARRRGPKAAGRTGALSSTRR